jgi:putative addiction module component (TIGR02574 family)
MKSISLEEIRDLSVSERIQLVEDIWDTVAAESPDLELTEVQKAELERRLALHNEDPRRGSPWSEVKARILNR